MKTLSYIIIGMALGGIGGVFFGAIFGIQTTKKSQREMTQSIQMPIFGVIGLFVGGYFGGKIASEEIEKEKRDKEARRREEENRQRIAIKHEEYKKSLIKTACEKCQIIFEYSTQVTPERPKLCARCHRDRLILCQNLIKVNDTINAEVAKLKMPKAKIKRYELLVEAAKEVHPYEALGIDTTQPTPTEIITYAQNRIKELSK